MESCKARQPSTTGRQRDGLHKREAASRQQPPTPAHPQNCRQAPGKAHGAGATSAMSSNEAIQTAAQGAVQHITPDATANQSTRLAGVCQHCATASQLALVQSSPRPECQLTANRWVLLVAGALPS